MGSVGDGASADVARALEAVEATIALTKDISSDSVGIVLPQPLVGEEVVVGFWLGAETMDEPWYFLGHAQAQREIGGGFWTVGVQFTEFLSQSNRDGIVPLAKLAHLLPAPAHEG